MKEVKPEQIKELAETFKASWQEIKEKLDSQQDEIRLQSEVLADLIEARKEQDEVLKNLIDSQF